MQTQILFYLALILGLFFIIWLVGQYKKAYQNKSDRLLKGSQIYPTAMGPIEAAIQGEGPAIVILHGAGGGYDRSQAYAHPEWGFKYITLSRPGYLRTPLSVGKTPAQHADALAALLDKLGIEKTVVMGVSAGGLSAIEFSLRHPDRCSGLILSSAIHQPLPRYKEIAYSVAKYILPSDLLTWFFLNRFWLFAFRPNLALQTLGDPQKQAGIKNMLDSLWPLSKRIKGLNNDLENIQLGLPNPLSDVRVPTLVIHGDADFVVSHRQGLQSAKEIPNAEFLNLPGGTHFCLISHNETAQPAITAFVQKNS